VGELQLRPAEREGYDATVLDRHGHEVSKGWGHAHWITHMLCALRMRGSSPKTS